LEKVNPSRPRKAKRTKKVTPPLSKEDKELFEEKVKENKYAPRMKVGKPQIGRSITVETVGLGNLKVITQDGNPNV
tara:strand:- start:565 stop:792 length:228 start_codon:yes stop_codon:yes gene_type:complete